LNIEPFGTVGAILFGFAFYYPLFMAYLWMIGAIFYFFHYEIRDTRKIDSPPSLKGTPPVTFLVPCHNDEKIIAETIEFLLGHDYPEFEIIAINDGSVDHTGEILDQLAGRHERLRVIHLASNQGKSMALTTGALLSRYEYLICIDSDALLEPHAAHWMMWQFESSARVAAVTGSPRIRNRSGLFGRIQIGEFSSMVGLIKRAQRTYGRLFTISGVIAGFRKAALHQVGYWSQDMLTEDIDITSKLEIAKWDVRFEPRAQCWILMPETLHGLWRQRLRWAMGGAQVIFRRARQVRGWRERRMWPIYLEYFVSMLWAYAMVATFFLWGVGKFIELPQAIQVPTLLPGFSGVLIGLTCMLQIAIGMAMDSRYEKGLFRYYFWMIWYPVAFWILNVFTTVVATPRVLLRRARGRATWRSPDRGLHTA
jgi:biofilm PGA synthesis N-glycosyltransferase PgaC